MSDAKKRSGGKRDSSAATAEQMIQDSFQRNAGNLDLSGMDLQELPDSLGQLKQLHSLDVSRNRLTVLPDVVGELTQLEKLLIWGNQLTALPESLGRLSKLQELIAWDNSFVVVPDMLHNLTELRVLDVSHNRLPALSDIIGKLTKLENLSISHNQLTDLPSALGKLMQLRKLDAWQNRLKSLPPALKELTRLKELYLHGNPELGLPMEILGNRPDVVDFFRVWPQKPGVILDYYFNSLASRPLNEAKLILVGRGGVGKTSLVRRLVSDTFDPRERKTDGIAITPWATDIGDDRVRLNIWDFGGQEIMHATHQFFFTKRSLYLLVLNAREGEQDANIEYWLRLIESFGEESPVIVVINKIKGNPFDLNRRGLQAKFPSIREFVQTDCEEGSGIAILLRAVQRETDRLEHLRDKFPANWFSIKEKLARLEQNFIGYEEYRELCVGGGITEATSQDTLVGFLHDLGIVLNFRDDPRLAETHVLNPHWVTKGIYKILNAETLASQKGELHVASLSNVLDPIEYPRRMHGFLLDLMRKFELCYEFYDSPGKYLVPELLGKEEPELIEFKSGDALRFEYHYNILPEGLLPRFIVRARRLNKDLPRWRAGAVLEFEANRAVVKADIQERKVFIAVTGDQAGRRRLLTVIRSDFEDLHRSIARLRVEEKVPLPEHPKHQVDYGKLRIMESKGITTLTDVIGDDVVELDVGKLLDGLEEPKTRRREVAADARMKLEKPIRIAISYSHKDEGLKEHLQNHLKLLERQGVLTLWHDREIIAGEDWKDVIDDRFQEADIVLLLISADFIASDYCYKIEMTTSLDRHNKNLTQVVPIIIRECQWHRAPFGSLEPLPKNGKAVTDTSVWPTSDKAWTAVASGIEELAEAIRGKRV
jgi:internalin A